MKHFIPLILIGFLGGAVLFIAPPAAQATLPDGRVAQQHYWEERIGAVGGAAAYEELAGLIASKSVSQQHQAAHVFGGMLYKKLGVNGLAVCDTRFNYACYHEFLGSAIADLGISSVKDLNQKCFDLVKKGPLACQHGIGHGVQSYFGYDEAALTEALEVCKSLPYNDTIGGCFNGAFMEYNLQTMLADQGKRREVKNDNWLEPCETIDLDYQRSCAYSQPQWWNVLLHGMQKTSKESSIYIGKLCAQYKTPMLIENCFEGYGIIVPAENDFDAIATRDLCDAVSENKQYQLFCKATAGNAITVSAQKDGTPLCDGLQGEFLDYCMKFASGSVNRHGQPPISE